jgi:hypothetical protein
MRVDRQVRQADSPRQGRHAIQRERSFAEVCRLRHAQITLPRGLHRTRVSEMRGLRVGPRGGHPFPTLERNPAPRLPVSTG